MESVKEYWEVINWIVVSFGSIFTLLLSAIVYLIYTDKRQSTQRFDKHEQWIMEGQSELKELARTTGISLEHNATTIEFVKEIMKDLYKNKKR